MRQQTSLSTLTADGGSVVDLFALPYNHAPQTTGGFMRDECATLLKSFFSDVRRGINKAPDGRNR